MRITFEQFLDIINNTHSLNPFELRYGQVVMNTLQEVWPQKYSDYLKTDLDCFYNDGIVNITLDNLKNEWIL